MTPGKAVVGKLGVVGKGRLKASLTSKDWKDGISNKEKHVVFQDSQIFHGP